MHKIKSISNLKAEIICPPDKSISHRAIILSSISSGKTVIDPVLDSDDIKATIDCMKKAGVKIKKEKKNKIIVSGVGMHFKRKGKVTLFANESGTTMRILSGLFAVQSFSTIFKGAPALNKRPMGRIVWPLEAMGASFDKKFKNGNIYPPLVINPVKKIEGMEYKLNIASAQVKSAIILAALYANKKTKISEPMKSRDHTEKMLKLFKVKVEVKGSSITVFPTKKLCSPKKIFVPGDFSSASFFIVLGLVLKNSEILIKNVNINPTRSGLLKVLKRMGANIRILNKRDDYEPYADILVKSSKLKATTVLKKEIPLMVDEIPILCVAASKALGKTCIYGVKELKVKETDRIQSMLVNLSKVGVKVKESNYLDKLDGNKDYMISIKKTRNQKSKAKFKSFGDHRTAMSMIVFSLASEGEFFLDNISCIDKSFPQFIDTVDSLQG